MKLEKKIGRIKELDRIRFPTPDQIEERLRLDEEVEIELKDSGLTLDNLSKPEPEIETKYETKPSIFTPQQDPEKPKEKRMTIYEKFIKPRIQKKPMTWDEVQQLKLEALGTRLKRHIAEDKAKMRKAKSDRINSILGMVTGGGNEQTSTKKRTKGKTQNKEHDDLRDVLGSNDPTKFDKLLKK